MSTIELTNEDIEIIELALGTLKNESTKQLIKAAETGLDITNFKASVEKCGEVLNTVHKIRNGR